MPAPRSHTALMELMTRAADKALESSEGVLLIFRSEKYDGMAGAEKTARALQKAFYAQMSRYRRKSERALGEDKTVPRDSDAKGMYDKLVLFVRPMENNEGWKCEFSKVDDAWFDLEIIDKATGKVLNGPNAPDDVELNRLISRFYTHPREFTRAEFDKLTQLDYEVREAEGRLHMNPWHVAAGATREQFREHAPTPGAALTPEPSAPRVDEFEALLEGDGDLFGEGD